MLTRSKKAYKGLGMEGFVARWYAKITGKEKDEYLRDAARIAARLPGGGDVLEVAPGPGYLAIGLAGMGPYRVVGLDISKTFVELARDNAARAAAGVRFELGNAAAMPFAAESFDFIVCRAAFKNFSEPVQALNEMHRVLRPGGTACIIDLRNDASPEAIDAYVRSKNLGRINAWMVRWTFRHMLLKRAYSQEQFHEMARQSSFGSCSIATDAIGLEVSLTR
jgi:ubiquinone/menaquinone biosynthesis C-methylase UbiE